MGLAAMLLLATVSFHSPNAGGAQAGDLTINEIMYDPYGSEVDGEWVELVNPGTQDINIKNWTLSDSDGTVDLIFPDVDVPSGAFILIHAGQGVNSTAFINEKAEFYMWRGSYIFPATGDDVLLSNETGATIDFVSFGQWNGSQVDPPPGDFTYTHSNATAKEGFSIAILNGQLRQSVPTPLEDNRQDLYSDVILTEVLYAPYGENEFMRIHNPTADSQDISFWMLTDGEGVVAFPSNTLLAVNQSIYVVQNASNFFIETMEEADFEYESETASIPDMLTIGTETYSGTGWTSAPASKLGQGHVAKRMYDPIFVDTNTSADWDNIREFVIGQSDFKAETFQVDSGITLFTSPDSSFECIREALALAQISISLNVYEFTNTALMDLLIEAIGRGVEVKVFLEGSPVGGLNRTELFITRKIVEAGGEVRFIVNDVDNDIYQRYVYDHAKYLVIDNQTLCIMSENWGRTGIPETGKWGNRGWGARIDDTGVARYFAAVFNSDCQPLMKDSVQFTSSHPSWNEGMDCTGTYYNTSRHFERAWINTQAEVTPVIAPDTALSQDTILGILADAHDRVCVEQFYIYKHWGSRTTGSVDTTPNIYLEAVIDAARRGCDVRILMDSTGYNIEADDPIDNDNTVEYVNDIDEVEGLNLEAKLVNLAEHDYSKIHNKGLIADDAVLISSINWNLNSVTKNREAGVIIDNPEVADYFMGVFEHDWTDDLTPPTASFDLATSYLINETVEFNASTSTDNVEITNHTWYLDGEVASYDIVWAEVFNNAANHTVELIVSDASENTDNLTRAFSVIPFFQEPVNETGNASENGTDDGDPDSGSDNDTSKVIAILLLVPIAIFIALLYIVKVRER